MADPLGIRRRTRGRIHPTQRLIRRVPRHHRNRRQHRRITHRQRVIHHHHRRRRLHLRGQPHRHLLIIKPPPQPRNQKPLRPRLPQQKPHLTLTVDRNDRILHRPQPRQRHRRHHRLHPRRQLPRHRRGLPHPQLKKPRRGALRPPLELPEGHPPILLIEQHHPIRRLRRPPLHQLPQRLHVIQRIRHQ